MSPRIVVRAPTRIDLGGGWTDVPPYCDREGGFVCNVAITRYATATITGRSGASLPDGQEQALLRAVQRRRALSDATIALDSGFPVGAGLGGSSAASAALLVAASEWKGETWDRRAIAEAGRQIEVEDLGIAGGRQDHYAATFGGALALGFTTEVAVRRITMDAHTGEALAARSLLVYTGQSRISGDTITAVLGAYAAREQRVVTALRRMRELAEQMAAALERADLDSVAGLLDEHWEHQRALHPTIPTPLIDDIVRRARGAGALGAKAMGASGGGCVLVMSRIADVPAVRAAIAPLGTLLDFGVDTEGVTVVGKSA